MTSFLSWWKGQPATTKVVATASAIFYFADPLDFSMCPLLLYQRPWQLYRLFLPLFFHKSLFGLLFGIFVFLGCASRTEQRIGSIQLLYLIFLLSLLVHSSYFILSVLLAFNPYVIVPELFLSCSMGLWSVVMGLIIAEVQFQPATNQRVPLLPFTVSSRAHPWVMLGLLTILFGPQLDILLSATFGCMYGRGILNFFLIPPTSLLSYESNRPVEMFTSIPGFISASATGPYLPMSFQATTSTPTQQGLGSSLATSVRSMMPTFGGLGQRLGGSRGSGARPLGAYVQVSSDDPDQSSSSHHSRAGQL